MSSLVRTQKKKEVQTIELQETLSFGVSKLVWHGINNYSIIKSINGWKMGDINI